MMMDVLKRFIQISVITMYSQIYCQITITSPSKLAKQLGNIDISNANFGYSPTGHLSNVNLLIYDYFGGNTTFTGCTPYNISIPNDHLNEDSRAFALGLIIDRGECTFVNKTRNAQNLGVDILIIADDRIEDTNEIIVLNDDGTGDDIIIPTVMISKEAGNILKSYLNNPENDEDVFFSINFELGDMDNIEIDIFGSSEQLDIYDLLQELKLLFSNYSDKDHKVMLDVNYVSSSAKDPGTKEVKNCLGGGKYCIWTGFQYNNKYINYDGREILNQNIIQKCIHNESFKHLESQEYSGQTYFTYMETFNSACLKQLLPDSKAGFINECSQKILSDMKILEKTSNCVLDSFESKDKATLNIVDNKILSGDQIKKIKYGVQQFPSVAINKRLIDSNNMQGYAVIEAICTTNFPQPIFCNEDGTLLVQAESTDLSSFTIVTIILLVVLLNVIIVYFCKRYIVRKMHEKIESAEMNGKINNVVSSYLALRG